MITITIELMGALRNPFLNKKRKNNLAIEEGSTISDFLLKEGFKEEEVQHFILIVNGERVKLDYKLEDQDHIFCTLPFGGGIR